MAIDWQAIAASMDAEPELIPFLPRLFVDLEDLGARADHVLEILRRAEFAAGSKVLDLGCGKGAVAVALAREFRCRVDGVDAMPEFIRHARAQAAGAGLEDSCSFRVADLHEVVDDSHGYDLACLLALGEVLGSVDEAVARLRQCVEPGGFLLIDDAYLRDDSTQPEDVVNCFSHERTVELLQSAGDEILYETIVDGPESVADYADMTAAIAQRAAELAREHPEQAELFMDFAARQQEEVALLTGPVVGAMWLIRRA